ncbi:MAG: hypothetical protein K2P88_13540 [Chitinophagaceae bacterium]|uniref:hypothetical protein n=1 Tax=unclassified Paraflavitalea TaxID=2798305 RepID=UPI003D33E675|nr:hypothetical protein [Chitinophagaceae bacterium]
MKAAIRTGMLVVFITTILQSCENDNSCESCQTPFIGAQIKWTGSLLNGGCDWVLVVDNMGSYRAINLPEHYQKDSLRVKLRYELMTQSFKCGNAALAYPYIRILAIQ